MELKFKLYNKDLNLLSELFEVTNIRNDVHDSGVNRPYCTSKIHKNKNGLGYVQFYFDNCETLVYSGMNDKNGKEICDCDKVIVDWLAPLGITELDCTASGTVYWDDEQHCFYVDLDSRYIRNVGIGDGESGAYEEDWLPLLKDSDNYTYEVMCNTYEIPEEDRNRVSKIEI